MFTNPIRAAHSVKAATVLVALVLAGCKGFWDPPPAGTGTSTGTTASATTLTSSNSSVSAGAGLTLTATVAPSTATGSVTFYAGTATLGTAALNSGTAAFNATFTTAGAESLTATYSGDATYASSTSSAVSVTVTSGSSAAIARAVSGSGQYSEINLVLSPDSIWTTTAPLHVRDLARLVANGATAANLDSSECILYSGTVFLADGTKSQNATYTLPSGGYAAPENQAAQLGCN